MTRNNDTPASVTTQMETFPRRLHQLMAERELSQSDLARLVWGTTTDARGYKVARNRDRVSAYLSGRTNPDPKNLRLLAKALRVTEADLAPELSAAAQDRRDPEIAMTAIAGHPEHVHLRVNKLVALHVAAEVIKLISENEP